MLSPVEYNIHVSAQVCRLYLHITPILQLLTGKDIVVFPPEQRIHATVIGIHTPTKAHQQIQRILPTMVYILMHGPQLHTRHVLHLVLLHLNFLPHHYLLLHPRTHFVVMGLSGLAVTHMMILFLICGLPRFYVDLQ